MRTLKFRAWDEQIGQMVYQDDQMTNYKILGRYTNIQQFTGLLDKNGREVFEGDILQYKYYYVRIKWWSTVSEIPEIEKHTEQARQNYQIQRSTVTYRDGAFKIPGLYLHEINIREDKLVERTKTGRSHMNDFEEKYWDFEVIGNVFENKNLLDELR